MSQRFKLVDAKGHVHVAYKVAGQPYETKDPNADDSDGVRRYELDDGRALDYHDDTEEFEIVETGERLTRVASPGA
jgi:hypothetical protein